MGTHPSRQNDPSLRRQRRRRLRWLAALAALLVAIVLLLPLLLAPIVRNKIQSMVADHLHARLDIGSLSYQFPYGVTVRDATFVTDPAHGALELLKVRKVQLKLASLPLGGGPVVIERLTIDSPVVRLVRSEEGKLILSGLAKRGREAPPAQRRLKLSDILRLRELNLNDATMIYEDRSQPDEQPMEWSGIAAHLHLAARSASVYGFELDADNQPIAQLQLAGDADVDALTVRVAKLAASASVAPSRSTSPLPAQLQKLVRELGMEGHVQLGLSGDVPLRDPQAGRFKLDLSASDVRLRPPEQKWSMDRLNMQLLAERGEPVAEAMSAGAGTMPASQPAAPIYLTLMRFDADAMGAVIRVTDGKASIHPLAKSWQIDRLEGKLATAAPTTQPWDSTPVGKYVLEGSIDFAGSAAGSLADRMKVLPRGEITVNLNHLAVRGPTMQVAVRDITGVVRVRENAVLLQNINATYGADVLSLNQGIISLSDLPQRLEMRDIFASATFAPPSPPYPRPLDALFAQARPAGVYEVRGAAAIYRGRGKLEPDYALTLVPKSGSVTLTDHEVPVTGLAGEIAIAPKLIEMRHVEGAALGGTVTVNGSLAPRTPFAYEAQVDMENVDLQEFSRRWNLVKEDGTPKLTGRALARAQLSGELRDSSGRIIWLDTLAGRGRVHVNDGDFWSVKFLSEIISRVRITRGALTAGQAAASFEIRDRRIQLRRAAISSPALGLQGSGFVGFDGSLDLDVILAPLGDWRKQIRSIGIPIFGEVAGELAGRIQKLVNTATSELLYEFRVRGRVSDPQIAAIPAPLLTQNAASVFAKMLRGIRADALADAIQAKDEIPPTTRPRD